MAFKIFQSADPAESPDPIVAAANAEAPLRPPSRQLTLRLNARPIGVAAAKPPARSPSHGVQGHIAHLAGQIDALRQQLRDHSTDRIALLLQEMIDEREHELDRWVARDEAWDQRLETIEGAIAERDEHRRREAELMRERDEARQAAAAAATQWDAAQRTAEAARRQIEAAQRVAAQATTEQLRLRSERELDQNAWLRERRDLARKLGQTADRGWLSRLVGR